ncbi:MAG: signal recognition particle-docking protein FtsY [Desulfovibrio sp.]|nr:signal recognition particle-docking protein FtsY [Desulfovibrio sp.]
MILALRSCEPKLSAWLAIVLSGVEEVGPLLFERIAFLLRSLEAPKEEIERFIADFKKWLDDMEYVYLDEFRSELQYRLALALELEDEEDERNRLLLKISDGLSKTRAQLSKKLDALLSSHGSLNEEFWEHLEELFITADLGYEASLSLVERLQERARRESVTDPAQITRLLREELTDIFRISPHITAYTAPEVVLMVGVNGVGKTTTIGKLAHRARLQGRKVMICAADTFRAAAIEQLEVWAERAGALFYSKEQGSDPASVAYEAVDRALKEGVDLLFVDTAGRLQTKTNLMEELGKIRHVLGKKHQGAPHRTVLVLDATTGQNALSQLKLFKESSGVDELILTKLDGTAKGGFVIALALEHHLPISFIGLGEKLEDLRPFNGEDFANALLEGQDDRIESKDKIGSASEK